MSRRPIDEIARDLAGGQISRRSALRRLAGAGLGLGAAMAPAGVSEALAAGCPPKRKCGHKCCPKGMRCKNGKCKCTGGLTKCRKLCVDTQTDIENCGACGNACESGFDCVEGQCSSSAVCGDQIVEGDEVCDGTNLNGQTCASVDPANPNGVLFCASDCQSFDTSFCTPR